MDDGAKGWMLRYAHKNFWKVATLGYDFDDLISDGYFCYYYVRRHYPEATEPSHIMSLFKRTFQSQIADLANKRTRNSEELLCLEDVEHIQIDMPDTLIAEAPEPIREILKVLLHGERLEDLRQPYKNTDSHRETTNERLCRLVGIDASKINLVGLLKDYLKSNRMSVGRTV